VHSDNAFRGGEDAILELAQGRLLSCSMSTSLSTAAEKQETGELMIDGGYRQRSNVKTRLDLP